VTTGRLEAFSDGVFAIAATLLILGVHDTGRGPLGGSLLHIWPSYVAYAVTFVTIGIIWVNHHTVFGQIDTVDRRFLLINVLFLMLVAFIPFPTGLVAVHFHGEGLEAAALAYGATLTVTAIFFNTLWFYAARGHRLLRKNADLRVVTGISRSYLPGPFIYLIATLVALASPLASVIMFAAITAFYVVESSFFGRSGLPGLGAAPTPGEAAAPPRSPHSEASCNRWQDRLVAVTQDGVTGQAPGVSPASSIRSRAVLSSLTCRSCSSAGHQFQRPSRTTVAGTTRVRTTNVSRATPMARPMPIS
jgi:uncharacterized membrane protein